MKALKSSFLIILSFSMLSCSLFLAPFNGRYNLQDPKKDEPTVTLLPSVDGYVDDTPAVDFGSNILWINPPSPPISVPIMRFNSSQFPEKVISAELYLWITTAPSPETDILAFAIVEEWSPTTIDFSVLISGTFFDQSTVASVTVPDGFFNGYVVLDVTEIFEIMIEAGNHGICLETTASAMNLHSTRGANPPKLVLYGHD
jgi:hypothetical protein